MKAWRISILLVFGVLAVLAGGCSDDDDPVVPEPPASPAVRLDLSAESVLKGETAVLSIFLDNLEEDVFALSLRIGYDDSVVEIDEDSGFTSGDYLGEQAISFFKVDGDIVYLSVTELADPGKADEAGLVGKFVMEGIDGGTCVLAIDPDGVSFLDGSGNPIVVEDLELIEVSLEVQ